MQLSEVVQQMYRMAGVLKAAGRGISPSEQIEGLHIINSLIDGLKIERLFFYQILRTLMNVNASKINPADYLVGTSAGADWVIERPEHILRAGYMVPGQFNNESEIPMQVLTDYTEYQAIVNKQTTSSMSWVLYYRASLPNGTARLWPVPYINFQVAIYTPGYVNEFANLTDVIEIPKGYRDYFEYGGAVAVHDRYPESHMLPGVEKRAEMYKSRIKAAQFTPAFIRSDPAAQAQVDVQQVGWWGAREFPGGY